VAGESAQTLKGVFTPRNVPGESRWNAEFRFPFQGQAHVYGTTEGRLGAGELTGTVRSEDQRRTFTFRGRFADGTFRGVHAELHNGRESRTGT